jgi:uncharacterized protein (DUF779 family)
MKRRGCGQEANEFEREKLANVSNMKGGAVFKQDLGCCPHGLPVCWYSSTRKLAWYGGVALSNIEVGELPLWKDAE